MNLADLASLALALGIGGAGGAMAAVVVSSQRVMKSYQQFAEAFQRYFALKTEPEAVELRTQFDQLGESLLQTERALQKLRRLLKLK